jgi:hypothetical protein
MEMRKEVVRDMCGMLDSEYEVLANMKKEDVVTYLLESYHAPTRDEATEAVENIGAWEE